MQYKTFFAQDEQGNVVIGAEVYVYQQGTTTEITVYDFNGDPITQPLITASNGKFAFRAPNGFHDIVATFGSKSYANTEQFYDATGDIATITTLTNQAETARDEAQAAASTATTAATDAVDAYEARLALLNEATLNLDFTNNTYEYYDGPVNGMTSAPFKSVVDFTRTSTATVQDAVGKIQSVGVDDQRLKGNREGLLIEEQRTNLLLWSEQFDNSPSWGTTGDTNVTANQAIAPDGELTADELLDNDIDSASLVAQVVVGASTVGDYTASIYLKANTSSKATLNAYTATEVEANVFVDLNAGTIYKQQGSSLKSASIQPAAFGYYRVSLTFESLSAGNNLQFRVWPTDRDAPSFPDTGSVYVWGAQLEQGSFPTSYIKTQGSQVTRSVDDCARTLGSEFSTDFGSFYIEFNYQEKVTGFPSPFALYQSVFSPGAVRFELLPSGEISFRQVSLSKTLAPPAIGVNKAAFSYGNGLDFIVTLNGVSYLGTLDSKVDGNILRVGRSYNTTTTLWNDSIKAVRYFPRTLTQAELEALTS